MSLPELPLIENKHRCGYQRIGRRMSRNGLSEFIGADRKNSVDRAGNDAWQEQPAITDSENDRGGRERERLCGRRRG